MDLYDLSNVDRRFDQIICYETIEDINDDKGICAPFYELLKPGGVLHLCCPIADHPRWRREILDEAEKEGRVALRIRL